MFALRSSNFMMKHVSFSLKLELKEARLSFLAIMTPIYDKNASNVN